MILKKPSQLSDLGCSQAGLTGSREGASRSSKQRRDRCSWLKRLAAAASHQPGRFRGSSWQEPTGLAPAPRGPTPPAAARHVPLSERAR